MLVFNGGTLANKRRFGIQRYTLELLKQLDNRVKPNEVCLVIPRRHSEALCFSNIRIIELPGSTDGLLGKIKWNHFTFPRFAKRNGIGVDLLLALPLPGCDVVCIHDCITELFPENRKGIKGALSRQFYMRKVRRALKTSSVVLSVSHSAARDISRYYAIPEKSIRVVPNGWQHMLQIKQDNTILSRLGLNAGEYFFALGSRYAHKNFQWITEAAVQNPHESFVVTGTSSFSKNDGADDSGDIPNVIFTGYLTDEEIKALMVSCRAFIQPSFNEGFGIPPLEAMSVGADCIVSDIPVFHEIYGESVWYFDPHSYGDIDVDSILSDLRPTPATSVLQKYSWEKSATVLLEELRRIG